MKKILVLSLLSLSVNAFASNPASVDSSRVEKQFNNPATFFINGQDANSVLSKTEVINANGEKKVYDFKVKDTYNSSYQVKYKLFDKYDGANRVAEEISVSSVKGMPMVMSQEHVKDYVSEYSVDEFGEEEIVKSKYPLGLSIVSVLENKGDDLSLQSNLKWSSLLSNNKIVVNEKVQLDLPSIESIVVEQTQRVELGKELVIFENEDKKVIATVTKL